MKSIQTDNGHSIKLAFTIPEAVRATGIGRSTLYTHIKDGRLRATRVGGRRIILAENLAAWLASFSDAEAA
jgi:excisionase family DNA binding protein